MSDTATRLRLYAQQFEDQHAPENITLTLREAAAKIELLTNRASACEEVVIIQGGRLGLLQAENERLRAALEDSREGSLQLLGQVGQLSDEITRLRAALERAASDLDDWGAYTKANKTRAAIAVVLEEAAKVAETMPCEPGRDGPQIAAAIRAMIPKERE